MNLQIYGKAMEMMTMLYNSQFIPNVLTPSLLTNVSQPKMLVATNVYHK
jgi:hypothetical protein